MEKYLRSAVRALHIEQRDRRSKRPRAANCSSHPLLLSLSCSITVLSLLLICMRLLLLLHAAADWGMKLLVKRPTRVSSLIAPIVFCHRSHSCTLMYVLDAVIQLKSVSKRKRSPSTHHATKCVFTLHIVVTPIRYSRQEAAVS